MYVHLLPGLIPPGTLSGGLALVIDVLRATTVMVEALASGCEAVVPCAEVEEIRAVAAALPAGSALLCGERQGLPIEGFDLGNSPGDFTPEVCRGKTLVMTTTNGTRAILESLDAAGVAIAALTNSAAVTGWASAQGLPIHLVCAGTEGHVSFEDTLLAGALTDKLQENHGFTASNDSALLAAASFRSLASEVSHGRMVNCEQILSRGRGGQRVRAIGLTKDIKAASQWDTREVVPILRRDPLRIVAGRPARDQAGL